MNEMQIFDYCGNTVRAVERDGEPWFVLKDVCAVLGIANHKMTAQRLDEDEVSLDRIREQTRIRVANHREKKRSVICNVTGNVTVTDGNATEEEKEDKEIDNSSSSLRSEELVAPEAAATPQQEEIERIPYAKVQKLYNDLCPKMTKCTVMSEARKKAIKARFASGYKLEDFERLFNLAAQSSFLNGGNKRNFMANFDWLIRDANMAKVLDGNYADRPNGNNSPDGGGFTYDYGDMSGSL